MFNAQENAEDQMHQSAQTQNVTDKDHQAVCPALAALIAFKKFNYVINQLQLKSIPKQFSSIARANLLIILTQISLSCTKIYFV